MFFQAFISTELTVDQGLMSCIVLTRRTFVL